MIQMKLKTSSFLPVFLLLSILVQYNVCAEADWTETKVTETKDGVTVTVQSVNSTTLLVEWTSGSLNLKEPKIFYKRVETDVGFQYVNRNSEEGLRSPVYIANLLVDTFYGIVFSSHVNNHNSVTISLIASTGYKSDAVVLSRIRRQSSVCVPNPCINNGACFVDELNDEFGYFCLCPPAFSGQICETEMNQCEQDPCQNGATCTDEDFSFTCECPEGFTGEMCESEIDPCNPSLCENGATCQPDGFQYTCNCPEDYEGVNCENLKSFCEREDPCLNGGTCVDFGRFGTCQCPPGYLPPICEGMKTCTVWGDPHYITFDELKYDFQGDCEYTLVENCQGGDIPSFQLVSDNIKLRPSKPVSYLRELKLIYQNTEYALITKSEVRVDDLTVTLPYVSENVTIWFSHGVVLLNTDFGLSIQYDGRYFADIQLLYTLFNLTCGLCGSFDGDSQNDFRMKNGTLTSEVGEFGESWMTGTRECQPAPEPPNPCTEGSSILRRARALCSPLTDANGPFSACNSMVDPQPYYQSCIYDLCVTLPEEDLLCDSLAVYAATCRSAGSTPENWRETVTQCPYECPNGTVYDACGTACPANCFELNGPSSCPFSCIETCRCPEGQVLDGDNCVEPSSCGCFDDNGNYHSIGDPFVTDDCSNLCECKNMTSMECQSYNCDENSECIIRNGVRGCYCQEGYRGNGLQCKEAPAVCTVWGDPHYITLDGRSYDFQGACEYILIGDCSHDSIDLPFELTSINRKKRPSDRVTYLEEVILKYNNRTYSMRYGGEVRVDDIAVTLPYFNNSEVYIFFSHPNVILETTFGLTVRYDGRHNAEIEVSKELFTNMTCGLCGTLDGNADNDFTFPDGNLATSATDFGSGWETGSSGCIPDPGPVDPCSQNSNTYLAAQDLCYILVYLDGPFRNCHAYVDPQPYYEACLYDTCATYPDTETSCDSFEIYDKTCRIAGGQPGEWRLDASQCSLTCPGDTVYDSCATGCPLTCPGQESNRNCSFDCVETCRCPDGQLLDGTQCVDPANCGCWNTGTYLSAGSSFVRPDCSERCTCMAGTTVCVPMSCDQFSTCEIKNGVRDCYCYRGFRWDGEKCFRAPAVCTAWGDPHYTTFDGRSYDFQGDCEYTMVKECGNNSFFEVIADNIKSKPSDRVAYVREVRLLYGDSVYQVKVGGDVLVNGTLKMLPYEDAAGVSITNVNPFITIRTDFGLTVKYTGVYTLHIEVDYQFYGKVCGLCGTYNDSASDDYLTSSGLVVASPSEFGNSWEAGSEECDPDPGPITACQEGSSTLQTAKNLCNELIRESGVFSGCHDFIDPETYYDTCLYDLCVTLPEEDLVCSNYQAYADACRTAGGSHGNWRDVFPMCAINCPMGSHYTECGTACPVTCLDPYEVVNCTIPCVETCQCNEGLVLDGDVCVPPSECGCVLTDGSYISSGVSFLTDDCSNLCECVGNATIECEMYNCDENSECVVRNGVRGCYCQEGYRGNGLQCEEAPAVCTVWGDPHYITFDGRSYDFQGACEYVLIGDCNHDSIDLPFELTSINRKKRPSDRVTYLEEVILKYNNRIYSMRDGGEVRVDDVAVTLPYLNNSEVYIFSSFPNVILETTFGLTVRYDGNNDVEVEVSKELYSNMTCGLCGTLDGNAGNDFTLPDGNMAMSPTNFGNGWETGNTMCIPDPGPFDPCSENSNIYQAAQDLCYILIYVDGPFSQCHAYVDPQPYYEACLYDTCATYPDRETSCDSFEIYDKACRIAGSQPGEWRLDASQCSLTCPRGTVYDSCATGCPSTCPGQDSNRNCSFECVETCRCPDGQLLDGTQCVDPSNCGCSDTGIYLSAGDSFVRPDCSERCTCMAGTTVCVPMSCGEFATCEVRSGVRDCYCYRGFRWDGEKCFRVPAVCTAWGDPHYTTFDGLSYDFQGDCEYTMVKECGNSSFFEVIADNIKNKPSDQVAYVREVRLLYGDSVYQVKVGGDVLVNGTLKMLPYEDAAGVSITRVFPFITIRTDFGLTVKYTGVYTMHVEVDYQFYGKVCGLCGTYNDSTSDDYLTSSGLVVASPSEFGNSWEVGSQECNPDPGPITACQEGSSTLQTAKNLCNELIRESGVFSGCHDFIDPETYYDTCLYDLCVTLPEEDLVCSNYQAYADACRTAGGSHGNWRDVFPMCAINCPMGSHYTECGTACPVTCLDPYAVVSCTIPCVETCQCNEGLVLDGDVCVPPSECGCVLTDGSYISSGVSFLTDDCSNLCECVGNATVECEMYNCDENSECVVRNGVRGCYCQEGYRGNGLQCEEAPAVCTVWGDPHYITFDGRSYDFQGACEYILIGDCSHASIDLPFELTSINRKKRPSDRVTYLEEVILKYNNRIYSMRDGGEVRVDDVAVTLPYLNNSEVYIFSSFPNVILETTFGLTVRYDGSNDVEVEVSKELYSNMTCGLCGTLDGDAGNDFTLPDGNMAMSPTNFGNGWETGNTMCIPDPGPFDPCSENSNIYQAAQDLCYILIYLDGPFKNCHAYVDPQPYYEACLYDTCATYPDRETSCDSFEIYDKACRIAGSQPGEWRSDASQCSLTCPRGTVYDSCATGCPSTCPGQDSNRNCSFECVETCRCPDGQLLDGTQCVDPSNCGCSDTGIYLSAGDSFVRPDCSERCTCMAGTTVCVPMSCGEFATCEVRSGVRDCYCYRGFRWDGEKCFRVPAVCTAWGDPHYTTFDGLSYDFQGDCEYTMVKECGNSSFFEVIADNIKNKPSDQVAYVREVRLLYGDSVYQVKVGGDVLVNGTLKMLPYEDAAGVSITRVFPFTTIRTDFGLTVKYTGVYTMHVEVDYQFYGKVCGLCGTYNDSTSDDYLTSSGLVVASPSEFGNSWEVGSQECNPDPGPITACQEGSSTLQTAKNLCNELIRESGVFSGCHDFIDPETYYDTCLYDLCVTLPEEDLVCSNYQAYADACRTAGGSHGNWRDVFPMCAINCPVGSHYTECGTACPVTCLDPYAIINCTIPCVETCQCNEGLVLDGDVCVPPLECGCVLTDGSYISRGVSFLTDDCSNLCECTGNATVECEIYNCDVNSECVVRNGVRGCYCQEGYRGNGLQCEEAPAVCTVWGDPHYITFDGRSYDFQGACEYILIGDCSHDSIDLPFELTSINRKKRPSDMVTYLEEVILKYNNRIYSMRDGGEVRVDDVAVTLPYLNNSEVYIFSSFPNVILETMFGLTVRYDGSNDVEVEVSKELYFNMTCGLCGSLDGNADNDFILPDGNMAMSPTNFGNGWETGNTMCIPDPGPFDPCSENSNIYQAAQDLCYILIYVDGPFKNCHAYVDPQPYYEACLYDTCATYPDRETSCDSFEIYDKACRIAGSQPGEWRSDASQCLLTCPRGTVYDSCATGCPSTCPGQESNRNCSFDCVETCRCPDGQLLDGTQCVDPANCGCLDTGIYLSAGDSLVRPDCSERCTCMAGTTVCVPMSCGEFATCEVRSGVRDCYCYHGFHWDGEKCFRVPAVCTAWGDPHYTTFDGRSYDFQGDCEYTMVKECGNNSFFEVIADNIKNKPSDRVAYVREVRLLYGDSVYQVKVGGDVLVNGTLKMLPYEDAAGVSITNVNPFITIRTDFGLTVKYDGVYTLHIEVDYQFYDKVCGLCGTYNDSTSDDYLTSNGLVVASPSEFGNSWEVGSQECNPDPGPITACQEGSSTLQTAKNLCNELIRESGVFSGCHDFIDPETYYDTCLYDLCATLPEEDLVCSNYQTYADACRRVGGNHGNWRDVFPMCAINCPMGSHYTECGTACPVNCLDPYEVVNCTVPCVETCQCNEGLVLDGDVCVPPSECGCVLTDGSYISSGVSFVTDDCSKLCECVGNATVECEMYNCDENSECVVRNGVRDCYCQEGYRGNGLQCEEAPATNLIWGDPHYMTFDGRSYDFQGACEYILIGDCNHDSIDFPFELTGVKQKRESSDRVSYLKEVILKYNNRMYALRDGGEVRVDGITLTLPYFKNSDVYIFFSYPNVILETTFGLTVRYDGRHNAEIEISKELYSNITCGMSGTLDGDADNDFTLPDGVLVTSATDFGNAWETGDMMCTPDPGPIDPCSENSDVNLAAQDLCYTLIYIDGPFSQCHAFVDPQPYYEACLYDTCATYPDTEASCDSFDIYDKVCRLAGSQPEEWRSDVSQCSFTCPGDTMYDSCATGCPLTCPGQESNRNCSYDCVETCRCPDGQLLDGTQCVEPDGCGCWDSGIYLSLNDSFVRPNCSERCTCVNGNTVCVPMSCDDFASCEVRDGVRDCYCYPGFSWDGEECVRVDITTTDFQTASTLDVTTHFSTGSTVVASTGSTPFVTTEFVSGSTLEASTGSTPFVTTEFVSGSTLEASTGSTPFVTTEFVSGSTLEASTGSTPFVTTEFVSGSTLEVSTGSTPFVTTEFVSGSTLEASTGSTPFVTTEFVSGSTVEVSTGSTPGITTNFISDSTLEASTESTSDVTTEILTDSTFGVSTDIQTGSTPDVTTDFITGSTLEASTDVTTDLITGSTLEVTTDIQTASTLDVTTDLTTGSTLEVTTDIQTASTVDFTTDLITGSTLEVTTDIQTASTLDVTTDLVTGSTLEVTTDIQTASTLDVTTDLTTGSTLEVTTDIQTASTQDVTTNLITGSTLEVTTDIQTASTLDVTTDSITVSTLEVTTDIQTASTLDVTTDLTTGSTLEVTTDIQTASTLDVTTDLITGSTLEVTTDIQTASTLDVTTDLITGSTLEVTTDIQTLSTQDVTTDATTESSLAPASTCRVFGDPHYHTFDGRMYDFMGSCEYKLASDCRSDVTMFEVRAENRIKPDTSVATAMSVTVIVGGTVIFLEENGDVTVNDVSVTLPMFVSGVLKIRRAGVFTVVQTEFDVVVLYDHQSYISIGVSDGFFGNLCGLCGNFNDQTEDDFTGASGNVQSIQQFGNSYITSPGTCNDLAAPVPNPCLNATNEVNSRADQLCSILQDESGIFSACIMAKPMVAQTYYESCRFDVCGAFPAEEDACSVIQAFAIICREDGYNIGNWRNESICSVTCPQNSTFEANGDPCPESCTSLLVPSFLDGCNPRTTVEGCQCDPGFVLEGSECVLPSSCGCVLDGFYAPVGLTFQTSDCGQECTCSGYGNLTCVNITCDVNAVCTSNGCMCMEGYSGDGLSCQELCSEGQFTCQDGSCISNSFVCNLFPDCPDFDDEAEFLCCNQTGSQDHCPKPGHFRCPAEGLYIPVSFLCDGYTYDCSDNYDESEELCSDLCYPPPSLISGYFTPVLNFYRSNNTVTYVCSADHTLVGDDMRSCNGFDFGNATFPGCYRDCNLPTVPQFSTFNNTDNTHGSVISLVCDMFYELETRGSYLTCNNGTLIGSLSVCTLIDQCTSDPCKNGGTCQNNIGFFTCLCPQGWTEATCETNINECLGDNDCHQNATCADTEGSYNCSCNEGFTGDGFYCREIRLFPFGDDQMDERLTLTADQVGGEQDQISMTIVPPAGFPIGEEFYYSLYFVDNGLVVFINENAEKFGFPNPYPGGFDGSQTVAVVAPFWTDSSLANDQGEVFYQVYERSDDNTVNQTQVLDDASIRIQNFDPDHPEFSASWLLVITWFEIPSFVSQANTNTFQVGLATDGTFSYALFNYEQDQMLWNTAALASTDLIIGYNTGSGMYANAQLDNPPFTSVADRFTPDQFVGNTGLGGRWIYRLEANSDTTLNPKQYCLNWYKAQPPHEVWSSTLGGCPCTFNQGGNDNSFRRPTSGRGVSSVGDGNDRRFGDGTLTEIQNNLDSMESFCLQTSVSPTGNLAGMRCCYRGDGSLIEGYGSLFTSSFAERFQYKFGRDRNFLLLLFHLFFDLYPRSACCGSSRDPYFCDLYAEKRPAGSCSGYLPPRTSWVIGDPHFSTLDGYQYTFNGLGDYQVALIYSDDELVCDIQGRTKQILNENTGQLAGATFFDAFAILYGNSSQNSSEITFTLNEEGTDFSITADGEEFNKTALLEGEVAGNGYVLGAVDDDLTNIKVVYIDMSAVIQLSVGLLDIVIQLPEKFRGNTRGLVGIWNGNVSDDFVFPNDTLLQPSGGDGNYTEQDFYIFGESWKLSAEDSLFDTMVSRKRRQAAQRSGFQPMFLSDLITAFEMNNPSFLASARSTCGSNMECLYDTLAAENATIGAATKEMQENNQRNQRDLANFPPNITADPTIIATLGELYYYQVDAVDPEGSNISYSLLFDNVTANISSDGLVIWNPVSLDQISLIVQASDGEALSAVQPTIIICNCQNNGTCQENVFTEDSDVVGNKFAVATCACPEAWTGDFCEEDFNACLDDPCFPGITCFDNEAPLTGNRCGDGTCPEGLIGDGFKCFDLDECVAYANRSTENGGPACQQICENTLNGFTCSCYSGYNLHPDMYQCIDIDECTLQTDECSDQADCSNTPGSYNCTCQDGYLDVNGDGRDCQDINECNLVPAICDSRAECTNTNGSFICTCNTGFEGDGRTCNDIDECTRNTDNCDTNADCVNTEGSFSCSCQDGWSGDGLNCTNINECLDVNLRECHPRAICEDNDGSYICFCPTGFFGNGVTCEDTNECETGQSDCAMDNSELCVNTPGSYMCICNEGFTSNNTDCVDVDECNIFNATQCSENANCENTFGSYSCSCKDGYTGNGITCMDVDECQTGDDDCNPDAGACSNTEGSFSCICITGYQGDGRNCTDIDECAIDSDDCSQVCTNSIGGFICSCYSGYEPDRAEPNVCVDVDECLLDVDNCTQGCNNTMGSYYCYCFEGFIEQASGECEPEVNCTVDKCINGQCYLDQGNETCMCYNGYALSPMNDTLCIDIDECGDSSLNMCDQICNNTVGGYQCSCNSGYRLSGNGRQCEDIDECVEGTDDCDPVSSTCVNEPGTFRCACNSGFIRNGSVCQDVNECLGVNDCSDNADCNNTVGSYQCSCKEGYMGNGFTCMDFDECGVPGQCDMFATCTNTVGSFSCECNNGFTGDGFMCMDIDECNTTSSSFANCSANAVCNNDIGSFTCTCVDGYEGDGRTCVDVDECSLPDSDPRSNDCDTDATCANMEGNYTCTCNSGYNGNGTYCQDINECDGANSCVDNSTCTNIPGSYFCMCNSGFRGDALVRCNDIDECVENLDGCDENADCANFVGGYSCDCKSGFNGTGFMCSDIDECLSADLNECHPLADCTNTMGSYICACQEGFVSSGSPEGRTCDDFDECTLDPCGGNEKCINMFGSFDCVCTDGYEEDVNGTCVDVNECTTRPCENVTFTQCENSFGGYNCICQTGYFSVNGTCTVSKAYSVIATFTDIKGMMVNMGLYTSEFQDEKKPLLEEDLTRLFSMSGLRDFLGVVIRDFSPGDGGVDVTFTVDLSPNTNVTIQEVEMTFLQGLTGRDDNVVNPDSIILRDTVLVTEPIYNPCEEQTDNCTTNAECIFLGTSYNYTCQCIEGFTGDGIVSCTDIDECEDDPCMEVGEVCVNIDGSYTCECDSTTGYFRERGMCVLYAAFQGEFTVEEVNADPGLAVFLDAYRDPTSLEFNIFESRVCGIVLYSFVFTPKLQQNFVECFVNSLTPGSIQTVWTVLFNLGVDATASELQMILLDSIVEEIGPNGILLTGTESLGNLTIRIDTVRVEYIVTQCPEDYCFNNATCSVIEGAYVCNCTDGYVGSRCGIPLTTQSSVDTTSIEATTRPVPATTSRVVATTQKEEIQTTADEEITTSDIQLPTTEEPEDEMIDWQLVAIIIAGVIALFLMLICCFCCCICEGLKYAQKYRYPVIHHPPRPDPATLHNLSVSQRVGRGDSLYTTRPYYYGHNYGYASDSSDFSDDPVDGYLRESEDRLRRLAQGIAHSPHLNEHMRGRTHGAHPRGPSTSHGAQFIRPYMASGHQEFARQPRENPSYSNQPRRASAPPPQDSDANNIPMTQFYPNQYYF